MSNKKQTSTFLEDLRFISILAQIFGILPVKGITKSSENVVFSWKSKRTLYCVLIISASLFLSSMALHTVIRRGFSLTRFIEHLLSSMKTYNDSKRRLKHVTNTAVNRSIDEDYFYNSYVYIFKYIQYSLPLGILCQLTTLCNTFSWNFLDIFIMIFSMALAKKFEQEVSRKFWKKIREDYYNILEHCQRMDSELSTLILVSFSIDLYFILVQLYNSLQTRTNLIETAYFSISFGLLLSRTFSVILHATYVNDEGQRALFDLLTVDSKVHNIEIERLIFYIVSSPPVLTGNKFFSITRGLVFSMANTIVTYELFLIQSYINNMA